MSESGNDGIFRSLFALIEWTFQVSLTASAKAAIESEVLGGWDSGDRSDLELVAYLLQLHGMLWKLAPRKRHALRPRARAIFKREFSNRELNDRGRILATLHGILEAESRGVTGVRGASITAPAVPKLTIPPPVTPPTVGLSSAHNPLYGGVPNQPPVAVAPPPSRLGNVNDFLRQQLDAQHETEKLTLISNIEAMKHKTTMSIIGNIR